MRKHAPRLGHRWPRQALRRSVGIRHLQTPLMKNLKLKERKTEWWVRDFGDCLNWKVCGYCLNWKVCYLILGIKGSETEMMVPMVESWRMEKMVGLSSDRWWYEDRGMIWFPLMKRAVASSIKRRAWCDFTLTVGPTHVCLFTKMPWKLNFDNLKISKMYFQFP